MTRPELIHHKPHSTHTWHGRQGCCAKCSITTIQSSLIQMGLKPPLPVPVCPQKGLPVTDTQVKEGAGQGMALHFFLGCSPSTVGRKTYSPSLTQHGALSWKPMWPHFPWNSGGQFSKAKSTEYFILRTSLRERIRYKSCYGVLERLKSPVM